MDSKGLVSRLFLFAFCLAPTPARADGSTMATSFFDKDLVQNGFFEKTTVLHADTTSLSKDRKEPDQPRDSFAIPEPFFSRPKSKSDPVVNNQQNSPRPFDAPSGEPLNSEPPQSTARPAEQDREQYERDIKATIGQLEQMRNQVVLPQGLSDPNDGGNDKDRDSYRF